jgi:hypothetical protein
LQAGRGGKEEEQCVACYPATLLPLAGRGGKDKRRCFSVALASRSGLCPQVLGVVCVEQWRRLGSASLPLPCCRGVGMAGVGRPWHVSLPAAPGIDEEWACPRPSQAAITGDSKLHMQRSYQRLSKLLWARHRSSHFFPEAKMPKRKIFHSCHDAGPSGSSLAPASSLWRNKSMARSVRSGANLGGPDGFLATFSRVPSIKL